jgi:hypothetical protein
MVKIDPIWKTALIPFIIGTGLLIARVALGEDCNEPSKCVSSEDMEDLVEILREKKCLHTETPKFTLDPITIVTDKDGRVFTSGSAPAPWTMKVQWCTYEIDTEGKVDVKAAVKVIPEYGFRVRPKAWAGLLVSEAVSQENFGKGTDGGFMLDFLYWKWINAYANVGVRSAGLGVGADITQNFGASVGASYAWSSSKASPLVSLYFSF